VRLGSRRAVAIPLEPPFPSAALRPRRAVYSQFTFYDVRQTVYDSGGRPTAGVASRRVLSPVVACERYEREQDGCQRNGCKQERLEADSPEQHGREE